jgi:hypothetical protein
MEGGYNRTLTSNADIGKTMARILSLAIPDVGKLIGRVVTEAMRNGAMPDGIGTASLGAHARSQHKAWVRSVISTL